MFWAPKPSEMVLWIYTLYIQHVAGVSLDVICITYHVYSYFARHLINYSNLVWWATCAYPSFHLTLVPTPGYPQMSCCCCMYHNVRKLLLTSDKERSQVTQRWQCTSFHASTYPFWSIGGCVLSRELRWHDARCTSLRLSHSCWIPCTLL